MEDAALLVERRDRLGAQKLAAPRMHASDRHRGIHLPQHRLHHLAALVRLDDDAVGLVGAIGGDRGARPIERPHALARRIGEHIGTAVTAEPRHDDAAGIGMRARRGRRIDRHHHAPQLRRRADARPLDQRPRPK